jgi:aminodeoxyfutalosine deaminase
MHIAIWSFHTSKGKLSGKNGIGGFLGEINLLRNIPEEELMDAARKADREMHRQGIVAVGDISNSSLTTSVKSSSPIDYFTFVEILELMPHIGNLLLKILLNRFYR